MEEEKKNGKRKVIECHEDLLLLLDKIREDVKYKTWEVITPSYYDATEILAKKIAKTVAI